VFEHTPNPKEYDDILKVLLKLSYPDQPLTKKKVSAFFKNERHRSKTYINPRATGKKKPKAL
jgi:disulfide oxidoreductase YuzD